MNLYNVELLLAMYTEYTELLMSEIMYVCMHFCISAVCMSGHCRMAALWSLMATR